MQDGEYSIKLVIETLASLGVLKNSDAQEYAESSNYSELLSVPFSEVRNTYLFNQNPRRSTQHGVRSEGHDKVLYVAETSTHIPIVHIDKLFSI